MKNSNISITLVLSVLFLFSGLDNVEAQIFKKIKQKAENTATRKIEEKTRKETEKAMDTILGNGGTNSGGSTNDDNSGNSKREDKNDTTVNEPSTDKEAITLYAKSDWVPGEALILFDDFSDDPVGDFPQLWNTNGSGDIITLSDNPDQKWLRLFNRSYYQPDLPKQLPKDFTVEFDVASYGIAKKNVSQTATFYIVLGDGMKALKPGAIYAQASLSPFQDWVKPQTFKSWTSTEGEIVAGSIEKDLRLAFLEGGHIAISVKGSRYRLYVNGEKVLDFPRAIKDGALLNSLMFHCYGVGDENQNVLISNLRVAEGLPEPRAKLFSTGKFVTNAILFDVNSAQIKPESYGILREIAEALKTEPTKNILIVGHTDSDGTENYNLDLSRNRAASVKDALVNSFGIPSDRLATDGKGESEPVAYNTTALEKAKNRRTEFIVQ